MYRRTLRVGVVSRTDTSEALEATLKTIEILKAKKMEVSIETETSMALDIYDYSQDLGDIDADFIISIGGDGTILRTAMGLKTPETPLLGINFGRRGFLCETSKDEIEQAIDKIIAKEYSIEESLKIKQ